MSDQQHPMLPPDANATPEVDVARRRFAKAGGGASVILATLASKPVLAGWCIKPSMAGSGNHSQHQAQPCTTTAPGDWKNNDFTPKLSEILFHKIGNNGGIFAAPSNNLSFTKNDGTSKTFADALTNNVPSDAKERLARALACAYLNAYQGKAGPITVSDILSIGYDFITYGYFRPLDPATQPEWRINEITAYLEQIWGSVAVYP